MPWNDFLGGDQVSGTDPLDILRSIAGSAVPQNAVGVTSAPPRIPNVPASAIPAKPLPGPMERAVTPGGGVDVRALLEQIAPLIGGMALHEPGQRTGFLSGYMQGQQLGKAEKEKKQANEQQRKQAAANFRLEVGQHALAIEDPVQRAQFVDLAETSGVTAGLLQAGDLASLRSVPASQAGQAKLRELVDQLTSLDKNYDVDKLAASGAHIRLKDGSDVSVATALDLTRARPLAKDTNAPIAKEEKVGKTAEERFLAKKAKELGKTVDTLTVKEELDAKTEYANAGRDRVTPTVPAGGVDAQFNDLVALWKEGHPGQEPSTTVRTTLRRQANQVNDKPVAAGPTLGGLDEDGLDYAATIFRLTNRMPPQGRASNGAYQAITNRAAKQAKDLGQSPAAAIQKQLALKADSAALTRLSTMSAAADAFESKALAQADIVEGLSNKVSRTQYPIINDGLLAGKARIAGDANTQLLFNALTTFTTEYAKIMSGATGSAGASSDSSRREAASLISASLNKGTLSQTLDLMRKEMRLTMQGYDIAKQHVSENMGGAPAAPVVPPPIGRGAAPTANPFR